MTSTPSTRRLLDGVAVSIPRARDTLVDFHTGTSKDARLDERLFPFPDLLGHPRLPRGTGGARLPAI